MDGLAVAEAFRAAHPDEFCVLARVPATFQKVHYNRTSPAHIVARKPIFAVDRSMNSALRRINIGHGDEAAAGASFHTRHARTVGPNGEGLDVKAALPTSELMSDLHLPDTGKAAIARKWRLHDLTAPIVGVSWAPMFEVRLCLCVSGHSNQYQLCR